MTNLRGAIGVLGVGVAAFVTVPPRPLSAFPQQPVFRAGVDHVAVDVIATDGDNKPVTDLKQQDFQITEGGRPQTIADFRYVSIPARASRHRGGGRRHRTDRRRRRERTTQSDQSHLGDGRRRRAHPASVHSTSEASDDGIPAEPLAPGRSGDHLCQSIGPESELHDRPRPPGEDREQRQGGIWIRIRRRCDDGRVAPRGPRHRLSLCGPPPGAPAPPKRPSTT